MSSHSIAPRRRTLPPGNTTKPAARVLSYVKRPWAPEMSDGGAAAYVILSAAIDALDAHIRIGGPAGGAL